MTLTIELPTDLEVALRARAVQGGGDLPELVVGLLRGTTRTAASPVPRLLPGPYPDESDAADGASYQPVPLPAVRSVTARFVPAGTLAPTPLAADE